jgi:hypothetical protein
MMDGTAGGWADRTGQREASEGEEEVLAADTAESKKGAVEEEGRTNYLKIDVFGRQLKQSIRCSGGSGGMICDVSREKLKMDALETCRRSYRVTEKAGSCHQLGTDSLSRGAGDLGICKAIGCQGGELRLDSSVMTNVIKGRSDPTPFSEVMV